MRDLRIRYWMVLLAMLVAVLLYLDRICLSSAGASVEKDLNLSSDKLKWILSAFFWTYAFAQLPAGWLGDRFGARWVLSAYVALWSLSTALLGFAAGTTSLLVLRLACGLFEAGAYPVCAGIVRRWVPAEHRGFASGVVSIGGRLGGAIAPIFTIQLMLWWTHGQLGFALAPGTEPAASSWRPVMIVYGLAGIVVALFFVWLYRDRPSEHPMVTDRELELITGESATAARARNDAQRAAQSQGNDRAGHLPLLALVSSSSLWLMSFVQFASNFGWAFLVTMLPRYLSDVHQVGQQGQGWVQSVSLAAGIVGLLFGGRLTDIATKRFGLRYGRAILLAFSRVLVAIAFFGFLRVTTPFEATLYLVLVGFATDLGIGATWAYGQDIGGRHVGSVVGWGNMWGNIGAALSAIVFGKIVEFFGSDLERGWQFAFLFCAIVQVIAAVAAWFVSAHRPLDGHRAE